MKDKTQKKKKIYVSALALALISSLVFGLVRGSIANAWGPERTEWKMEDPADYATYNSIINNPVVGDERDFVRVRELTDADDTDYVDEVTVKGGKDYEVWIYYHNDAATTYNKAEYNWKGVAQKTRVMASFPDVIEAGDKGKIYGQLYSVTANPTDVWDEAYLKADEKVKLTYVVDSAISYNAKRGEEGLALNSDELFSKDGTYIGVKELNGMIPGCAEYSGHIVYRIHAEKIVEPTSSFEMNKSVSVDAGKTWAEDAELTPGTEVEFKIDFKNTGTLTQYVTISDTFESGEGLEYVVGSTRIIANGQETIVQDEDGGKLFNDGVAVGLILANDAVEVKYKVKVKSSNDFVCGKTILYNLAGVSARAIKEYDDKLDEVAGTATQYDKVKIVVTRDDDKCLPGELPSTGPAELVLCGIIIAGLIVGLYYYYHSKKTLKEMTAIAKGDIEKPEQM